MAGFVLILVALRMGSDNAALPKLPLLRSIMNQSPCNADRKILA
jgi:hypothetical protein